MNKEIIAILDNQISETHKLNECLAYEFMLKEYGQRETWTYYFNFFNNNYYANVGVNDSCNKLIVFILAYGGII